MENDYDAHLFELLDQAAQWPRAERRARAEEACAGGPVKVEELLRALRQTARLDDFLVSPAWEEHGLGEQEAAERDGGSSWEIGDHVGRYRLREALGQGGMGQVFLAEQQEPYRRVALKLIRPNAISEVALDRFRAEQQALARLNHPHIAQFYEAGVTPDGQPYFAMEWVAGTPIDAYLQSRPLNLGERLRLFLEIGAAVHHAHLKQVVHRDLKPTNILVREVEGQPIVKVIDFGIAEALDRPLGRVHVTDSGGVYGTPEYLSPESFAGDVDTRADVYSLGVLLYELVSGSRPFRWQSGDLGELLEQIRQGATSPPSLAATESRRLNFKAASERRRWIQRLRGDLDAIVKKAMHPDRDQRYGTVADLTADVERFLAHEPVRARATGSWHQLRLLLRRRRGTALAATLVLLSLVAGTVGIALGFLQARREAEATRQALEASEELAQFLTELFEKSDPAQARGAELTARDLLDQGAKRLRIRLQEPSLAKARLTRTIGDIYAKLGYYEEAESLLDESLALFRDHYGETHPEATRALHGLAVMKTKAGEVEEARELFEQTLQLQEANPETDPYQKALTLYHLGVLAYRTGHWEEAEPYFDRACDGLSKGEELMARCLEAYGSLRQKQERLDEAKELFEQSLGLREKLLGEDHPHVAASLESLCILHTELLELELAGSRCARSLSIRRQAFGDQHLDVIRSFRRLAVVRRLQGRYEEADTLLQEALAALESLPHSSQMQASFWVRSGWVSWLRGRYSEAATRYRRAVELFDSPLDSMLSNAHVGMGICYWKKGRFADAERELQESRTLFQERYGPESTAVAWTSWGLAGVYRDRGDAAKRDLERAGELYRQALEIRRRSYPEEHESLVLTEDDYQKYLAMVGQESAILDEAG